MHTAGLDIDTCACLTAAAMIMFVPTDIDISCITTKWGDKLESWTPVHFDQLTPLDILSAIFPCVHGTPAAQQHAGTASEASCA